MQVDFIELKLIEKIGNVLSYAVSIKKYNRYELIEKWLGSETYLLTVEFDVSLCSQAKTHILRTFERECGNNLPTIDENSPLYADDVYWFGYVMAYWFFTDGTTGNEILQKYNVRKVLDEFDVLHTLSVKASIEKIKEDDLK